jgi:hypothetical protein
MAVDHYTQFKTHNIILIATYMRSPFILMLFWAEPSSLSYVELVAPKDPGGCPSMMLKLSVGTSVICRI